MFDSIAPHEPYDSDADGPEGNRLAVRLGVDCPNVRTLWREIDADLDSTIFGIGWWAPHPDTRRRILISDHLLHAVHSIETNLIEAQLHLHEARHAWKRLDTKIASSVKIDRSGNVQFDLPARTCPDDDLPSVLSALHVSGIFRAVGSALDCLSSAIVGVLGLPMDILKADLKRVLGMKPRKGSASEGQRRQRELVADLIECRSQAGPSGWWNWANESRNMLVHRARRITKNILLPSTVLLDARGNPLPRVRAVEMLPREPGLSELQVLLTGDPLSVLKESAETTLFGLIGSTRTFVEDAASVLRGFWCDRREAPDLVQQSSRQWPAVDPSDLDRFVGYAPEELSVTPDMLSMHPHFQKRFKCAALADEDRHEWDQPD